MILQKSDVFVFQEIKGKLVILNSETGDYFGLNAVGLDFLNLVDAKRDTDEIILELLTRYEIDETTLRKDILALVEVMQGKGIVTQVIP